MDTSFPEGFKVPYLFSSPRKIARDPSVQTFKSWHFSWS